MKKIFIGYTSYQDIVYQVAKYSIESRSSDCECYPIIQQSLRDLGIYRRVQTKKESTEFSITRFLTPWLAGYQGWVLFCDNDVVLLDDINNLFAQTDDKYAVMCVKHSYAPENETKLDGKIQSIYPRKNWSSVVLWNCDHPKNKFITPDLVNEVSPLYLHRFMWLEDEEIGSIHHEWNWLVDWYSEPNDGAPKLLHYTNGGPYFRNYQNVSYADVWIDEYKKLMGRDFSQEDVID